MSDVNKHAEQVAIKLASALKDEALDQITGGYDPVMAKGIAEQMFASGAVKADGVSKEVAMDRLARALEGVTLVSSPTPAV